MVKHYVQPGEKFNHLTVIERSGSHTTPSGAVFSVWKCKCDCGNMVDVLGSSLTSGHTKSCGCLQTKPKKDDKSMLNRRFGRLTVISRAPSHRLPSGSVYDMWNCVCDCGNKTVSFGRNLRDGRTVSCGCYRVERQAESKSVPKAEIWAKHYFDEHDIEFEYQKTFAGLVGARGGLVSYDFYLPSWNVVLELNGLQHYVAVDWFGGDETLNRQKFNDAVKKDYAEKHGLQYCVIDTDHISHDDLIHSLDDLCLGLEF